MVDQHTSPVFSRAYLVRRLKEIAAGEPPPALKDDPRFAKAVRLLDVADYIGVTRAGLKIQMTTGRLTAAVQRRASRFFWLLDRGRLDRAKVKLPSGKEKYIVDLKTRLSRRRKAQEREQAEEQVDEEPPTRQITGRIDMTDGTPKLRLGAWQ